MPSKDIIVGIQSFITSCLARCILVVKFQDTLLGENDGLNYEANYIPESHVQVYKQIENIPLSELDGESNDIKEIPSLIYEPQTLGSWSIFGYFYDRSKMKRTRKRTEIKSLEIFTGAGGSLQGYHNNGFKTIMAVEKDKEAARTLQENNKDVHVSSQCVRDIIKEYATLKSLKSFTILRRIDHVHLSPPCQGFSSANRNATPSESDLANNDLSLMTNEILRMTSCSTAVFENVIGMWRRKNIHYIKNIVKGALQDGFQVRCTTLKACDYGDPQKRPRFFIFLSKKSVPVPSIPRPICNGQRCNFSLDKR